ncbi:DNA polymerase III subunit delta [Clostridium sp.]|uniref:DNA polymerase III subunit delta n=1 Tax=Clostridium sp. TaxID=1506 RepID=UPI002FC837AF
MIGLTEFEGNLKKNKIDNCYIFCGTDENLIKTSIEAIIKKIIEPSFKDFNYTRYDGEKVDNDTILNSCETLPFMSSKKIVEIYRSTFLEDANGVGSNNGKKVDFNELFKYINNMPEYTILIMYYIFDNDRDKISSKVKKLDGKATVVKIDKLKGQTLQSKVKDIFQNKGKSIEKSEISFFCSIIDNNMNIINNEIDKLISYTDGREIKREDIIALMPPKSENDIFNLVDYLSQKNVKKSIDILNELVYKGEKPPKILYMIERQFKLLLALSVGNEVGKSHDMLAREFKLNPYIAEKMLKQSKKFSINALRKNLKLCIDVEKMMKSTSADDKTILEMLIINSVINK